MILIQISVAAKGWVLSPGVSGLITMIFELIWASCLWFCVCLSLLVMCPVGSVSLFIEIGSLLALCKVSFRLRLAWLTIRSCILVISFSLESYNLLSFFWFRRPIRSQMMVRDWFIFAGRIGAISQSLISLSMCSVLLFCVSSPPTLPKWWLKSVAV